MEPLEVALKDERPVYRACYADIVRKLAAWTEGTHALPKDVDVKLPFRDTPCAELTRAEMRRLRYDLEPREKLYMHTPWPWDEQVVGQAHCQRVCGDHYANDQ